MIPPPRSLSDRSAAETALLYHEGTKHPNGRLLDPHHRYGPSMDPPLAKLYQDLPSVPLPRLDGLPSAALPLAVEHIAYLLHYSAGVTKRITYPGWGTIPFRAAACTGALYHIELYLVCADLPGLPSGVYHYQPLENTLDVLRRGDYRANLAAAAAQTGLAPAYLVYTDVPFRNAVKYQARAYRHAFWDSGTILANSLALTTEAGIPTSLILGFSDEQVNELLGLDGLNEYTLALLTLGESSSPHVNDLQVSRLDSALDTPYRSVRGLDVIQAIHSASSLPPSQVNAWRLSPEEKILVSSQGVFEKILLPASEAPAWRPSLAGVIRRRGSTRRFTHQAINLADLAEQLAAAYQPITADYINTQTPALTQAYLAVNAVDGLAPGAYRYDGHQHSLAPLRLGENRPLAGFLALGQALGADAAVNIYFLAPLLPVLERFGGRGYRLAQLDAAIRAGRIYLAAYNQSLGSTGLTFYDDEVIQFFSPAATGFSVMFLVAVGVPAPRRDPGG